MTTRMCDLPHDLVGEKILAKVPTTSLRAVRSTCKLWNDLSKDMIVGKATSMQHEFLGFMTLCNKVCSLRFNLQGIHNHDHFVDPSVNKVALLDQVEISSLFHCDGLSDVYALGYDNNRNHKILRLLILGRVIEFEIYDFSSSSWRVLDDLTSLQIRSGQRLSLPYNYSYAYKSVTISCVREEQLAIEPNAVSWRKSLNLDTSPLTQSLCRIVGESFFIDEKKKVVVVFNEGVSYIFGEDGYLKPMKTQESGAVLNIFHSIPVVIVSFFYLPSLVQIKKPCTKERDA
ncbi:hypothetical protein EUTSA_v10027178mg [Eutrema salsugineum]|uniref:F-box domain-containing protein n=1 Tax=Eutrema salsugineum TaxID=72664 RepID=V4P7G9_EUTSA|nr:hypothetical protein EUTSA_v10027178mg [Eutrema salsugineum]